MTSEAPEVAALFVADATGLDFLNSVATPVDEVVDWLADGQGLLGWLGQAQLVPPDELAAQRRRMKRAELDRLAAEARALREWFRTFVRAHMGKPLPSQALRELTPLTTLLSRDQLYPELVRAEAASERSLILRTARRWDTADALLMPIAEAIAKVVAEEDFRDLKACEGSQCTLLFADHTRRRSRRWCTMAVCGNRAKQAAHRSRLRDPG